MRQLWTAVWKFDGDAGTVQSGPERADWTATEGSVVSNSGEWAAVERSEIQPLGSRSEVPGPLP
ncbi:hypothetical protein HP499_09330 [Paenarthrobacter sp. CM16]|uniref:hypothetical protein n=1 Tax=Paenarthrobacter sp. CM16 TaxID=2738447 RepID=UPI0015539DEA|nr:hypothetical protein [Paenarthrobacter sp. CM16]NQD88003.1 hypothetical protein [Paenarthrobacter sp. CM16]